MLRQNYKKTNKRPARSPNKENTTPTNPPGTGKPPKLVLQITIDQLRGDLPKRYLDRMRLRLGRGARLRAALRELWRRLTRREVLTAVEHSTTAMTLA